MEVEVSILNCKLLLYMANSSKINDLISKTHHEYTTSHLNSPSFRICYVQDNLGRILSSDLPLFDSTTNKCLFNGLECVVSDMNAKEVLPSELLLLYRKWQTFTVETTLIQIERLMMDDSSMRLNDEWFLILSEMHLVPNKTIQLLCMRCFNLFVTRVSDMNIVTNCLNHLLSQINSSNYYDIVDEGLVCLVAIISPKKLSQSFIETFESSLSSISIDTLLIRFPDNQSILLHKYKTLIASLTLSNRKYIINNDLVDGTNMLKDTASTNNKEKPVLPSLSSSINAKSTRRDVVSSKMNNCVASRSDWLQFIQSEDISVRTYYLTSLFQGIKNMNQLIKNSHHDLSSIELNNSSQIYDERNKVIASFFTEDSEFKLLLITLQNMMKRCIHTKRNSTALRLSESRDTIQSSSTDSDGRLSFQSKDSKKYQSKASKIINKAFHHSQSDVTSLILIMECLYHISCIINGDKYYTLKTTFYILFKSILRLLLTISHAANENVSELAAKLLCLVIDSPRQWKSIEIGQSDGNQDFRGRLVLENEAVVMFLTESNQSSYRFYLGLSYLYCQVVYSDEQQIQLPDCASYDLLCHNNYVIIQIMLKWIQKPECCHRTIILVCLRCLACLSISNMHVDCLLRDDVVNHLITYLCQKCVYPHDNNTEEIVNSLITEENFFGSIESDYSMDITGYPRNSQSVPLHEPSSLASKRSFYNQGIERSPRENKLVAVSVITGFDYEAGRLIMKILSNINIYYKSICYNSIQLSTILQTIRIKTDGDKEIALVNLLSEDDVMSFYYNLLSS